MVQVVSGKWTEMTKDWRGTCPDKVKLQHWSALASHSKVFQIQWLGWSATQKLLLKTDPEVGRSRGSTTVYPFTVVIGWTRGWSSGQASFQCNENHSPTVYYLLFSLPPALPIPLPHSAVPMQALVQSHWRLNWGSNPGRYCCSSCFTALCYRHLSQLTRGAEASSNYFDSHYPPEAIQ